METHKPDIADFNDRETGLSSRIGRLTAATLDAASDFFKAGETGVKQMFTAKKTVRRREITPHRVAKMMTEEFPSITAESGGALTRIADLEKKIEIGKIINLEKIADLERIIDLERSLAAERFAEFESRIATRLTNSLERVNGFENDILDMVADEIEKRIAERISAALKSNSEITEKVLLHRISDLESRLERESICSTDKLVSLESRITSHEVHNSLPDPVQESITNLENKIETASTLMINKVADFENRLTVESRNMYEKLTTLENRITIEEAKDCLPDSFMRCVYELESKLEVDRLSYSHLISEIERRLERDSRSILEKLITLDDKFTSEIANCRLPDPAVADQEKILDLESCLEQEINDNDEESIDLVVAEAVSAGKAVIETNFGRTIPVLGKQNLLAGLTTVNKAHLEIKPSSGLKKTIGGIL